MPSAACRPPLRTIGPAPPGSPTRDKVVASRKWACAAFGVQEDRLAQGHDRAVVVAMVGQRSTFHDVALHQHRMRSGGTLGKRGRFGVTTISQGLARSSEVVQRRGRGGTPRRFGRALTRQTNRSKQDVANTTPGAAGRCGAFAA